MFQNEYSFCIQDIRSKYQVGKFRQSRMVIRGICKNDVKRLGRPHQVFVCIGPYHGDLFHLEVHAGIPYEFKMGRCHFNGYYGPGTPGGKFVGYAAGTGEQVKYIRLFHAELVNQNIKQALLGKIGGWPGLEICRRTNLLSSEYTADYAHLLPSERIMKRSICSRLRCSRK